MDSDGCLWIPNASYGFQRIPTDLWIPIDSYGFQWIPMDSCRFLWILINTVYYDIYTYYTLSVHEAMLNQLIMVQDFKKHTSKHRSREIF